MGTGKTEKKKVEKKLEEKNVTPKESKKVQKKKKNKLKEVTKLPEEKPKEEKPKEEAKKKKVVENKELKKPTDIEPPKLKKAKKKEVEVTKKKEKKTVQNDEDAEDSDGNEDSSENDSENELLQNSPLVSKKRKIDTTIGTPSKLAKTLTKDSPQKLTPKKGQVNGDDEDDDDDEGEKKVDSGATNQDQECQIYFGNVPFTLDEAAIRKIFKDCGEIASVQMIKDKLTGNFKGYGFLKFSKQDTVKKALELDGKELNGRNLRVVQGTNFSPKAKSANLSIYFGNSPPDLKESDLRELFKDCGEIAKIRLLNNPHSGEFRRSGFVDFASSEAAKKALKKNGDTIRNYELRVGRPQKTHQKDNRTSLGGGIF